MAKSSFGFEFLGLNKGIELLSNIDKINLNLYEFFALSFYLNDMEIKDLWKFSNKDRTIISKIMDLVYVTYNDDFNSLLVYTYGLDISLMANNILVVLGKDNKSEFINELYNNLKIKKTCDLKYKGMHILQETNLKNASIIGDIIDELKYQVVVNNMPNDYDVLREFALKLIEEKMVIDYE